MTPEALAVLQKAVSYMESHGISYMVFGGQAAARYGLSRPTTDVDISVDIESEHIEVLRMMLRTLGWSVLLEKIKSTIAGAPILWAEDPESGVRIDFHTRGACT